MANAGSAVCHNTGRISREKEASKYLNKSSFFFYSVISLLVLRVTLTKE